MGEITGDKTAQGVRSLILERLSLFLHECTRATTEVSFTWLDNKENFVTRTFQKLSATRSIDFAGARPIIFTEPSVAAVWGNNGRIELWLTDKVKVDMYEVATSLFRLLFRKPKVDDTFLFATVLSADLRTLRRRGYNGNYEASSFPELANRILVVNHILKRRAEEEARAVALAKVKAEKGALVLLPQAPSSLGHVISKSGWAAPSTKRFPSKMLFSIKGPEEPVTSLEELLVISSGVAPTTLGIGNLTGILSSLEY